MRTTRLAQIGRVAALATALAGLAFAQSAPDDVAQLKAQLAQQQQQI